MPIYQLSLTRKVVSGIDEKPVKSASDAVRYFMRYCFVPEEMCREAVWALFLDKSGQPVGHFLVGLGGMESVPMDLKMLIATALLAQAKRIVLAHNHPTGDVKPSPLDIQQTTNFKRAIDLFGITLIDHVVIGDDQYYSFTEEVTKRMPYERAS